MLPLLSLLGYPTGYIINRYTKEELQQAEQYFKTAYKVSVALIAVYAGLHLQPAIITALLTAIGVLLGHALKEECIYTGLIAPLVPALPITGLLLVQTTLATTQKKSIHSIFYFAITYLIISIIQVNLIPLAFGALMVRSFK